MDVLVNNAGFGAAGSVADLSLEKERDMVQVNVAALTQLTRLLLPGMIQRRSGGILNIGSTAGFQPGPYMAVYYATKAYVLFFTEALAEELLGSGVLVTLLAPGPTATEFAAVADLEHKLSLQARRGRCQERRDGRLSRFSAWAIACCPRAEEQGGAFAVRFAPRAVVRKMVKRLQF